MLLKTCFVLKHVTLCYSHFVAQQCTWQRIPLARGTSRTSVHSSGPDLHVSTESANFFVSSEQANVNYLPLFARERRHFLLCACEMELISTGLLLQTPGTSRNVVSAKTKLMCSACKGWMPPPPLNGFMRPAPDRLCSGPRAKGGSCIKVSEVFCRRDPLEIVCSIVAFVQVFVVHKAFMIRGR